MFEEIRTLFSISDNHGFSKAKILDACGKYGNQEDEVICVLGGDQMLYASSNEEHFAAMETFMGQMNLEAY